jgi:hypothetical protein
MLSQYLCPISTIGWNIIGVCGSGACDDARQWSSRFNVSSQQQQLKEQNSFMHNLSRKVTNVANVHITTRTPVSNPKSAYGWESMGHTGVIQAFTWAWMNIQCALYDQKKSKHIEANTSTASQVVEPRTVHHGMHTSIQGNIFDGKSSGPIDQSRTEQCDKEEPISNRAQCMQTT